MVSAAFSSSKTVGKLDMIHPNVHLNILNISINRHYLGWQLPKNIAGKWITVNSALGLQRNSHDPSQREGTEGAAGVNKGSPHITGPLDKSWLRLCVFDVRTQGSKLTQFEWIWTTFAITHHSPIPNHCWHCISRHGQIYCITFDCWCYSSVNNITEQNVSLFPSNNAFVLFCLPSLPRENEEEKDEVRRLLLFKASESRP